MNIKYTAITPDHLRIARDVLAANPGFRRSWKEGIPFADPESGHTPQGIERRRAEVAKLAAEDWTPEQIATRLNVNPRTISRIIKKLEEAA